MKNNFILKFFIKNKIQLTIFMLLLLGSAIFSAYFSVLLGEIFDIAGTNNYKSFHILILKTISSFLIIILFTLFIGIIKSNHIAKIFVFIKSNFIEAVLRKNISTFKGFKKSEYISVLVNDINYIQDLYIANLFNITENMIKLIVSVITLLVINLFGTIIVVIFSIIPILLAIAFNKRISLEINKFSRNKGEYTEKTMELLNGFDTFTISNSKDSAVKLHSQFNINQSETKRKTFTHIEGLSSIIGISAISVTIFTLLIGMFLALKGFITIGQVFAISFISNGISSPLMDLFNIIPQFQGGKAIIEKYNEFIYENNSAEKVELGQIKENIVLTNMSIEFDRKILNSINFEIELGKKYLLIGESGSGKSIFLKTILGQFIEYSGEIHINNIDIKKIDESSIYKNISYIPQESFFFQDTIRNNITLYDDSISEEKIMNVLEFVNMKETILNLPEKLDTEFNETKSNLSGGEKQRLSIARSLLSLKPVLFMDESTSALDNANFMDIENKILNFDKITIVNICHRLKEEIMDRYDKIIKIENGVLEVIK